MPKRKNNKNKRKNKNRSDVKNVSDDKGSDKSEACSSDSSHVIDNDQIIVKDTENQLVNACIAEVNLESTVLRIPAIVHESSSSRLDQDLNNNSNDVEVLNQPVINETNDMHDETCDIDSQNLNIYVVESPEQSLKTKSKLSSSIKSKSLDNDDEPKIEEITDEVVPQSEEDNISSTVNKANVIISDAESDMEWEKTDDLENQNTKNEVTGKLSITTIPLNVAQCELTKSLTPEEEISLRNYLHTLNLSKKASNFDSIEINAEIEHIVNREICHRLRKKGLAEDFLAQRLCPPRILDVIDEESGESSLTSRRHSYLSDKKSDIDELDDDVFEDKIKSVPKIGKDINIKPKHTYKNTGHLVPQQCILVDAKIKEPEISEARGNWTTRTVEKMSGAEIIYLTDSSSSTSSLHDLGGEETDDGAETDLSVRMITPTIEVTDTENLLKNNFVSNSDDNSIRDSESMSSKQFENFKRIIDGKDNAAHEVIVLSTDNIKTDLYVKELDTKEISEVNNHMKADIELNTNKLVSNENTLHKPSDQYDLEIKVLKCELNQAMNNLIKEYSSDSEMAVEDNIKESFTRQDSSSSIGSSQCTAKYNPTYSSLNDVSNIIYDEMQEINQTKTINPIPTDITRSHVKDVFKHITEDTAHNKKQSQKNTEQPSKLRDLCVLKIATFPYGEKILQELAHVSKRLQNINVFGSKSTDVSQKSQADLIEDSSNETKKKPVGEKSLNLMSEISLIKKNKPLPQQKKDITPPPVQPRKSSFKKPHADHSQTSQHNDMKSNPIYLCQSPSQKMLMDKTNTVISDVNDLSNNNENMSLERTKCNEFCPVKKRNNEDINPSAISFKSQTGSRLLALLRDPSVSNNLTKSRSAITNKSFDKYHDRTFTETSASNKYDQIVSGDRIKSAKPIPPPRPKKYSALYESDESSEFTDNSLRSIKSKKKLFHYSTGNLNKEIENDVSSIQNMHRYYTNVRDDLNASPRRPSLPKDLCDQQMEYIKKKEKEVEAEIRRLEGQKINASFIQRKGPKAPLISEKESATEIFGDAENNYFISHQKDVSYSASTSRLPEKGKLSSLFSSSQEEILRDKMYSEYVSQMAERQERRQQKIIKITNNPIVKDTKFFSKSMNELDSLDIKLNNRIEKEFISKARERWNKLGIKDPETEDEREDKKNVYCEPTNKVIEHKIKVFESGEEKDVKKLPNHLQEFVRFAAKDKKKESGSPGESENGPASSHVVILCAVIIIVLAFGKYFLHLFRNK